MNYNFFKIYRENKKTGLKVKVRRRETKSKFSINKEYYSLNDILKENEDFLEDKIFEVQYLDKKVVKKFKYV